MFIYLFLRVGEVFGVGYSFFVGAVTLMFMLIFFKSQLGRQGGAL